MWQKPNQMNNSMVAAAIGVLRLSALVVLIALTATAQYNSGDFITPEEIKSLKDMAESLDMDELKDTAMKMKEDGEYLGKRFQGLSPEMIRDGLNPEDVNPLTRLTEQEKFQAFRRLFGQYPPDMQERMNNINAEASNAQQQFQAIAALVDLIMSRIDGMMESIDAFMKKISLMIANIPVERKDVGDPPNKNKSLNQLKADMERLEGTSSQFTFLPKENPPENLQGTTRISSMKAGSFSNKPSVTSVTLGN